MKALISIIIPVYNRESIIKETLDSILLQSYSNWECILVDDGSADNTWETLKHYSEKDARFKLFERPKDLTKGSNACRNFGFLRSQGEYINWFDSDDIMKSDFLECKISAFLDDADGVLHRNRYANYQLTRFRDSKFSFSNPENLFFHYAMDEIEIQTSGMMWKRSYLEGKPLFDESIQRFQDNEFHIRILALKPKIIVIEKVLATIRGGDGDPIQISSSQNLTKNKVYDIFFYWFQSLSLNKNNTYNQELVEQVVSKKILWTFYEVLKFEKNIFRRFKDVRENWKRLSLAYASKGFNFTDRIKSQMYLTYLLVFGGKLKKNL